MKLKIIISSLVLGALLMSLARSEDFDQKAFEKFSLRCEQSNFGVPKGPSDTSKIEEVWDEIVKYTHNQSIPERNAFLIMDQALTTVTAHLDLLLKSKEYNTQPKMNIYVPGIPFSGADPNGIKDPIVKKRYLEALAINDAQRMRYNYFRRVQNFQKLMVEQAQVYVKAKSQDHTVEVAQISALQAMQRE
jgi:hypothetical protein